MSFRYGHTPSRFHRILIRAWQTVFFARTPLLAGIALGGLGATIGGTLYFLHYTGKIDVERVWQNQDRVEIKVFKDGKEHDALQVLTTPSGPPSWIMHDADPSPGEAIIAPPDDVIGHANDVDQGGRIDGEDVDTWARGHHSLLKSLEHDVLGVVDRDDNDLSIPLAFIMPLVGWTAALLFATARAWYVARLDLVFRNFYHTISYTLVSLRGGHAVQRRLMSADLQKAMYDNEALVGIVKRAAGDCVARGGLRDPVLFMSPADAALVVPAIRGPLSEKFASGFLAIDQGNEAYSEAPYWFAMTYSVEHLRIIVVSARLIDQVAMHGVDLSAKDAPVDETLPARDLAVVRAAVSQIMQVREDASVAGTDEDRIVAETTRGGMIPVVGSVKLPVPGASPMTEKDRSIK